MHCSTLLQRKTHQNKMCCVFQPIMHEQYQQNKCLFNCVAQRISKINALLNMFAHNKHNQHSMCCVFQQFCTDNTRKQMCVQHVRTTCINNKCVVQQVHKTNTSKPNVLCFPTLLHNTNVCSTCSHNIHQQYMRCSTYSHKQNKHQKQDQRQDSTNTKHDLY